MTDTGNMNESQIIMSIARSQNKSKNEKKEKKKYPHCSQVGGKRVLGKIPEYLLQIQTLPPHTLHLFHINVPNKPVNILTTPSWPARGGKSKNRT